MALQEIVYASDEVLPEEHLLQTRRLLHLMYIQALFLGLTYVFGIWLATVVGTHISFTQLDLIMHVTMASIFASLTAAAAFVAMLQREKLVASLNLVLFLVMVLAGFTGFVLLGNISSANQFTITNFAMMGAIGFGMPVTGYSIARVKRLVRTKAQGGMKHSSVTAMALLTLISLPLTVIAGVTTMTISLASSLTSLYPLAVAIHFAFAAVTVSLVLGVLVLSVLEGVFSASSSQQLVQQRVAFSILGLAAVSLAGGTGIIAAGILAVNSAGISYIVLMAEVAVLVYASMILVIAAPFKLHFQFVKRSSSGTSAKREV